MSGYRGLSALRQGEALFRSFARSLGVYRLGLAVVFGVIGSVVLAVAGAEPVNAAGIGFPAGAATFLLVTY